MAPAALISLYSGIKKKQNRMERVNAGNVRKKCDGFLGYFRTALRPVYMTCGRGDGGGQIGNGLLVPLRESSSA